MFTGIIETVGTISSLNKKDDVLLLNIFAPKISKELKRGDSVSIDGVCSTVVDQDSTNFRVEMMEETLQRTTFGKISHGTRVNLERALHANMRFDGHFVSGHVDSTATVHRIEVYGKTRKYFFKIKNKEMLGEIVPKGSIAIDGISLTIIDVTDDLFSVGLIPTTLSDTTFLALYKGDTVNIETDILGKYVIRYLNMQKSRENLISEDKSITWDKLNNYGWI